VAIEMAPGSGAWAAVLRVWVAVVEIVAPSRPIRMFARGRATKYGWGSNTAVLV
jgi:hypothetical protein